MPLETGTYISDLVVSNPAHTDQISASDSHLRLIKSTLKATFPNLTGPVTSSQDVWNGSASYGFFGGSAALPGLTPIGSTKTGWWSPSPDVINYAINGVTKIQYFADGSVAFAGAASFAAPVAFTGGLISSAIVSTGAYSGGTGQLVPIGAVLEWYDDTLPVEGGYAWANGQIVANANTVCPVLLSRWGSKFGGNGTTTMGLPDRRETVAVGKSTMGGTTARGLILGYVAGVLTTLGQLFGASQTTLTTPNLPPYTPSGSVPIDEHGGHSHDVSGGTYGGTRGDFGAATGGYTSIVWGGTGILIKAALTGISASFSGNPQGGTSTPFQREQTSTVCNYIVRLA